MRRIATLALVTALAAAIAPAALAETDDAPAVEEPAAEEPSPKEPAAEEPADPAPKPKPRRTPPRVRRVKVTRDIVFPIVGATQVINGFGSCRDNCRREHHGNDILTYGWKGLPVVASHDGVITEIRDDGEWCNAEVTGEDGWHTRYVHMNNDTPGYDDEDYSCVPPGLTVGSSVKAGQLIGWVGDSGNAEHTQPHIHYEIRMPSGLPVDPLASLKAARRINLRQVGGNDVADAAAQIARYAYPDGAPTAIVMSIDDYQSMLGGGYLPIDIQGPLLLSDWDTIPAATVEALNALAPARVEVIGDLWLEDVLAQLDGASDELGGTLVERGVADELDARGRVVEASGSLDEPTEGYGDGIASVVAVAEPDPPPAAPYALVLLGDRDELGDEEALSFDRLTKRVGTMIMDFADPDGRLGNAAFEGVGRSGRRGTLYYATGGEWQRYAAREAPEDAPNYGCFVVEPADLTAETMTFLTSIAGIPVMPLWR
jgi:murein DD-endopeptidase MepM/ murein hydrolase activator NlpD